MALTARLERLKPQGDAFHPAADHGHVQLVGLGKAVLGAPLHHLVLRLLGTPVGKALHPGDKPLSAAVHHQQHKAAHQQGQQLGQADFPLQLRRAEDPVLKAVHQSRRVLGIVLGL